VGPPARHAAADRAAGAELETPAPKANDRRGDPIEIAAVVV
jgi:hypothetical protein